MGTYARQMEGCANGNIPSACILSSAAAIGGVAACAALSAHFSADDRTTHKARYNGALWGLATGLTSGSLMLYLRGKRHVIPCHWPCVAGFVPPAALGCWATASSDDDDALEEKGACVAACAALRAFCRPKDALCSAVCDDYISGTH